MMIHHFAGEGPLKIKDEGFAKNFRGEPTHERAFVQMPVNDIGFETPRRAQDARGQKNIQPQFMPRRTNFVIHAPRNRHCAFNVHAGKIAPARIRDDADAVSELLQREGFFKDAHMAAVIAEKRCRRDHQNFHCSVVTALIPFFFSSSNSFHKRKRKRTKSRNARRITL